MASSIFLDSDRDVPLHRQIYEQLRDQILTGHLTPGERLPSTRAMSEALGVSRTTVTQAYEFLLSEGYLDTTIGSGTYVSRTLPGRIQAGDEPAPPSSLRVRYSRFGKKLEFRDPFVRRDGEFAVSFRPGRPDYSRFPMAIWRRLLLRHCRAGGPSMLDYAGDGQGYGPLREEIARYVLRSRSVKCTAAQVVVVNGSQQALDLIARVLSDRGDTVAVEDPCYQGAFRAFESHGARLWPVPVDEAGLIVDRLERGRSRRKARFVYVTPSHQFPTGHVLSLPRRFALLHWADRHRSMIVEDDYDSEYRYESHPLPSLQGLEPNGRVLYAGTFSKVLFPALRIGYVIAPEPIARVLARAKWLSDRQTPLLEQYALADFIRHGYLERHIRRMRSLYDERRKTLVRELREQLGTRVQVRGENTGMHLMVNLCTKYTPDEISKRAAQEGLGLFSARPYYLKAKHSNEFVLGYANLTGEQIRDAVARLRRAAR